VRVERLEHVQLAMPAGCEEQAQVFYEGILGIPRVPKPPHLDARGGCWFEAGDLRIHLGVEEPFRPARKAHPALVVDDLPALIGLLAEGGFPTREDEPLAGWSRVYVDDPFGNRLELMEPAAGTRGVRMRTQYASGRGDEGSTRGTSTGSSR